MTYCKETVLFYIPLQDANMTVTTDAAYFRLLIKLYYQPHNAARNTSGLNLYLLSILLSYDLPVYMIVDIFPEFPYVYFVYRNSI